MNIKSIFKKSIFFSGLTVLIGLYFATKTLAASNVDGHKIVIDAGHGGSELGTTECDDLYEKDANLDIAERLRTKLEDDGATVYMTRTDNSTLSNRDRYESANSTDGEVLVSIHLNGSTDHSVNGTMTLYGKRNKDKVFAQAMHLGRASFLVVPDQGITNFASGLLLKSKMPAVITESVYLSNETECKLLRDGDGTRQQKIVNSLYDGLNRWFALNTSDGSENGGDEPNCPPTSNSPKCR